MTPIVKNDFRCECADRNIRAALKLGKTILLVSVVWIAVVSVAHSRFNLDGWPFGKKKTLAAATKFRVGFIPVTCHLTCPVTDYINRSLTGEGIYEPLRFVQLVLQRLPTSL